MNTFFGFLQAPMVLKQLENNMGRAYVHILSLACTVIIILHLFACLFHYVTLWDEASTWVESSGIVNTDSLLDRCGPSSTALRPVLLCGTKCVRNNTICMHSGT